MLFKNLLLIGASLVGLCSSKMNVMSISDINEALVDTSAFGIFHSYYLELTYGVHFQGRPSFKDADLFLAAYDVALRGKG